MELLAVDRCFTPPGFGTRSRLELHHFSDGSLVGHGAVSYLRMVNGDSDIHCTFVKAKAKLNPMKAMTIPRVELTAAVVAVKLDKMLRRELDIGIAESYFWTDSMLVLRNIQSTDRRFHTFVANRVAAIQSETMPSQWRYVNTSDNPADDTSRGLSAGELVGSQ
ncbi:uncharacterized protein LOC135486743 [Lineus longissimus]|uniref:uncharacterized protein LOC135486743 n=1 Tax=Lineus longissimus TaxID=88925 RepID=UPI00315CE3F0